MGGGGGTREMDRDREIERTGAIERCRDRDNYQTALMILVEREQGRCRDTETEINIRQNL